MVSPFPSPVLFFHCFLLSPSLAPPSLSLQHRVNIAFRIKSEFFNITVLLLHSHLCFLKYSMLSLALAWVPSPILFPTSSKTHPSLSCCLCASITP